MMSWVCPHESLERLSDTRYHHGHKPAECSGNIGSHRYNPSPSGWISLQIVIVSYLFTIFGSLKIARPSESSEKTFKKPGPPSLCCRFKRRRSRTVHRRGLTAALVETVF
uniref:Uncharacterized protein n=1 Tax=Cacopsylla melanoneura TaxID=428564 RepID=A0A8D8ZQR0_9HEMI